MARSLGREQAGSTSELVKASCICSTSANGLRSRLQKIAGGRPASTHDAPAHGTDAGCCAAIQNRGLIAVAVGGMIVTLENVQRLPAWSTARMRERSASEITSRCALQKSRLSWSDG